MAWLRQALFLAPGEPLPVEFPDVVVRREGRRSPPGTFVKGVQGVGNEDRIILAGEKANQVGFVVEFNEVAGKVFGVIGGLPGDFADLKAEVGQGALGGALLQQAVEADGPGGLMSAMLAGDFVESAVEGTAQTEVILVQGQDLIGLDCIPEPFGDGHLAVHEPAMEVVFPAERCGVEDAEDIGLLDPAGADVGADCAAAEAEDGALQACIVATAKGAVGEAEQVRAVDHNASGSGFPTSPCVDDVGNRVDQNILVKDRGKAEPGRVDLDAIAVLVRVGTGAGFRAVPGGEAEEGELQMVPGILDGDVADVDREQVRRLVSNGQEGRQFFVRHERLFRCRNRDLQMIKDNSGIANRRERIGNRKSKFGNRK